MSIYLVKRAYTFAKIMRLPAYQALSYETRSGIAHHYALETARGLAFRGAVGVVIGQIFDPYSNVVVPAVNHVAGKEVLITSGKAAAAVIDSRPRHLFTAPKDTTKLMGQVGVVIVVGGGPETFAESLAFELLARAGKRIPKPQPNERMLVLAHVDLKEKAPL